MNTLVHLYIPLFSVVNSVLVSIINNVVLWANNLSSTALFTCSARWSSTDVHLTWPPIKNHESTNWPRVWLNDCSPLFQNKVYLNVLVSAVRHTMLGLFNWWTKTPVSVFLLLQCSYCLVILGWASKNAVEWGPDSPVWTLAWTRCWWWQEKRLLWSGVYSNS